MTAIRDDGLPEGSTAKLLVNGQSDESTEIILDVPQTLSGTSAVSL